MSYRESTIVKEPTLGILIYLFAGLLAITLWKGLAELTRHEQSRQEQPLAGALRTGAAGFDEYRDRIVIEQPQVIAASPAIGDPALEFTASVRNDTGRVIKGLEVRGMVVDEQGEPVSERIAVIIPTQQTAIEPDEVINARLLLEGLRPEAAHASIRLEVTGVIFD
jgi:hypothetical protein